MSVLTLIAKLSAGAIACLLALELLLQALPVSTATRQDFYIDPFIKNYPPNSQFRASNLWDLRQPVAQKVNSTGFASAAERNRALPGLALIGDSFVEGSAVPEHARVTERMRTYAVGYDPIMLGLPGTSLLDYLDRAQWARAHLSTDRFIFFIDANDGNEAVCGSGQHGLHCLNKTTGQIDTLPQTMRAKEKDFFGKFATLQYFLGHLKLSLPALTSALRPVKPAAAVSPKKHGALASPASALAIEHFLSELHKMRPAKVMLVIDCDRKALYDARTVIEAETHAELKARNARYNIPIVELCPRFQERYARDTLRTEVSLTDTHWNARGHDIVAERVAQAWLEHYPKP
jgi:hypothetical protein